MQLLKFISKYKIILLVILTLAVSGFNVWVSYLFQIGIEAIYDTSNNIITVSLGLVVSSVLYIPLHYLLYSMLDKVTFEIISKNGIKLFENILKNNSDRSQLSEGNIINLLQNDIDAISGFLKQGLFPLFSMSITLIVGLAYAFINNWLMAIVFLISGIILLLMNSLFSNQMQQRYEKYATTDDNYKTIMEQFYHVIPIVRVFNIGSWLRKEQSNELEFRRKSFNSYMRSFTNLFAVTEGGIAIMEIVILLLGMMIAYFNKINIGIIIGVWNAGLGSILYPMSSMPNIINYYSQLKASILRTGIHDKESNLIESYNENETMPIFKDVIIKNVHFGYGQNIIYKNFNQKIYGDQLNYVVGKSGSGKTTLMKILLGLLEPQKGEIVDENNNKIKKGNTFAYVPQQVQLFNISLLSNLILDNSKLNDYFVREVCDKLNILDLIESLPDGFETVYGKEISFSNGQTKRIGIARALLSDRKFIILDEPFSDLDSYNQELIMSLFETYKGSKVFIIVTHTYDFIKDTDNIIKVGDS